MRLVRIQSPCRVWARLTSERLLCDPWLRRLSKFDLTALTQPQLILYFPENAEIGNLAHGNIASDFHVFLCLVDE
jgi:hypothetical protein